MAENVDKGIMTKAEREVVRAVEAAVRDHYRRIGAYYSGPATGIYLRVRGLLQTEIGRALLREEVGRNCLAFLDSPQ